MNMMHPEQSLHLTRLHEADARRTATRYQLARIVSPERKARIFRPFLASLGKRMVAWGTTLESRYEDCADAINTWQVNRDCSDTLALRT